MEVKENGQGLDAESQNKDQLRSHDADRKGWHRLLLLLLHGWVAAGGRRSERMFGEGRHQATLTHLQDRAREAPSMPLFSQA